MRAKENKAKCRFLFDDGSLTCNAGSLPYIPTDFQFQEYCLKTEHRKCPFYLENVIEKQEMIETEEFDNHRH